MLLMYAWLIYKYHTSSTKVEGTERMARMEEGRKVAESWTRRAFHESLYPWTTHRALKLSEAVPMFLIHLIILSTRRLAFRGMYFFRTRRKTSRSIRLSSSSFTAQINSCHMARGSVEGNSSTR